MDPYYSRHEVSNSDLVELQKLFMPVSWSIDTEQAFKMGTGLDCMITEPEKVNLYKRTIEEYTYKPEEIELLKRMKTAFYKDDTCKQFMALSSFQTIFSGKVPFTYGHLDFDLDMRCKYDFWMPGLKYGGDIKSTFATSQKQFEEACYYFNYDQSRVLYMLLSGAKKDLIIGVSKENCKVFKLPITPDSKFYQSGLAKLEDAAFRYWSLFENFKISA